MASSPSQPSKAVPVPVAAPVRVGHVYLDVGRHLLHCLNDTARQLLAEGVPFTSGDLATNPLKTLDGKLVGKDDMPLRRAWQENKAVDAAFILPRDPGPPLQLTWTASPLHSPSGTIIGVMGAVTVAPPEPDWQTMAGLAHDLRTPLQSLTLLVELADGRNLDPAELADLLARIRASTGRALGIALELLDWCRGPVRASRALERAWVPLEPFLASLAAEQTVSARHKSLALVSNVAAARGWECHTDRGRLGRLLSNLLVNAIRYTTTGQVEFTASWRDDQASAQNGVVGRKLALSIVDTGAGISTEEQESIFQPFERGRAGKEGDSGGSGLGLAVVDRLVEELGLELEVYSEYGRGSAFHLLLPAAYMRHAESPEPPNPPS
jgi:peptidoglycan hydrolase-like protein with peptidoglycan-binding domain